MINISFFSVWMIISFLMPMAVPAQNLIEIVPLLPSRPSLWWQSDRLELGLIDSWSIDQNGKIIKLKINSQVWLAADYVKRYAIMQKLGTVARESGYDILLENNRQIKLAEYKFGQGNWQISPPSLGANPFSANNGIFFGLRN